MTKRLMLAALCLVLVLALSSCINIKVQAPSQEETSVISEKPEKSAVASLPLKTQGAVQDTSEQSAEPSVVMTEAPVSHEDEYDTGEGKYAYINALSMCMDGETDITLDYVDWLYDDEAVEKFMMDYPDTSEEELEDFGIYEYGYIRNSSSMLYTFHTGQETRYFLPDQEDMTENSEVSCNEFRSFIYPAFEEASEESLPFVYITVDGEDILSISWVYTP